ncbi:hypothetical protein OH76DRAFT_1018835 [Lentinus brumalis]|uniref:Uncharacterized protein n=1 Tax=Lentinus brumalis TaxID=2498619 RepID=A0A371CY46_9APHY|nr:hypothetical protein OH76DRAFT_1018835 [Polyporus brumalis]
MLRSFAAQILRDMSTIVAVVIFLGQEEIYSTVAAFGSRTANNLYEQKPPLSRQVSERSHFLQCGTPPSPRSPRKIRSGPSQSGGRRWVSRSEWKPGVSRVGRSSFSLITVSLGRTWVLDKVQSVTRSFRSKIWHERSVAAICTSRRLQEPSCRLRDSDTANRLDSWSLPGCNLHFSSRAQYSG